MKLLFSECAATGNGILKDLAAFSDTAKYLRTIVNDVKNGTCKLNWLPTECCVTNPVTKKKTWLIKDGTVTDEAEDGLARLARIPATKRQIMSDTIVIEGDAFEHELYVSWE